ncbi:ribosome recycling factor [Candidatus Curculioniphilus buchneri]|uniref:ribosome recycling factor n=1 Tax=Candidatus Curculioniphilus buchneri TaxID=690594 RepID=UPI00376EF79C
MINKICAQTDIKMEKCIEAFKTYIRKIRTDQISPNLLDHLQIECYGSSVSLRTLSHICIENSRSLVITVFDHALIPSIEKAIMISNLGLNPFSSGAKIHVPCPPLSEQRRRDMIKIVRSEAEQRRISVRNIRRDANEKVKSLLNNKFINIDEEHRLQQEIQKLTDAWIKKLDIVLEKKEFELMKT